MALNEPSQEEIIAARERGYAIQATFNGVSPDDVVSHIPVYNSQASQREGRLTDMHKAILSGRGKE